MCTRTDDPTQHDVPGIRVRLYDVTYVVNVSRWTLRRVRVWAADTDEARAKAKALDPEYLNTTRTPRIVR